MWVWLRVGDGQVCPAQTHDGGLARPKIGAGALRGRLPLERRVLGDAGAGG